MPKSGVIVLVALFGFLAWRMATLDPPALPTDEQPTETQALFEALKRGQGAGQGSLLRVEADGRLRLPESDQALMQAWQRGESVDQGLARLLRAVYSSAAGTALQSQLVQWNRGRRVAAVRDNHSDTVTHAHWRAHDCGDGALLASEAPVPERFGYIHPGRIQTGFGDWQAVGGEHDCVEFRGYFQAKNPAAVRVLYLGTPLNPPGSLTALKAYDPPRPFAVPACAGFSPIPAGQVGEGTLPKNAWRRSATGGWDLEVRLQLAPAINPDVQNPGVRIAFDAERCQPTWQPESPLTVSANEDTAITTVSAVDGPLLIEGSGKPTAAARKLGLIPLLGFGPGDFSSLSGLLHRSQGTHHLTLTIDSRIQAIARDVLLKNRLADRYQDERRAVLVVLDATDGAILAAAAYPEPPPLEQVIPWDFRAFSRAYPLRDPLQVQAWEGGGDRHQLAGSTFKPMVALAALNAAKQGNTDIAEMLDGWESQQFVANTGVALDSPGIDPYQGMTARPPGLKPLIHNFDGETLNMLSQKSLRDPRCAPRSANAKPLGLAPALRDSLNSWFIAAALRLDGEAIDAFDTDTQPLSQRPVPDLWLIKALHQMGFGTSQPLLAAPPAGLSPNKRPYITADQIALLIEKPKPTPLRWVVAQTAIGQGVSVTPLRMATLAASLAQGKLIKPRLDAAWDSQKVASPTMAPLDVDLTGIRAGMKAVPEVGTVHTAFDKTPPAIRCRTYAKTGTAEVGQANGSRLEPYNTAWLMGWHEPEKREVRSIAFACMITHSQGTGGDACGPVVAELLKRVSRPAPSTDR